VGWLTRSIIYLRQLIRVLASNQDKEVHLCNASWLKTVKQRQAEACNVSKAG
jgi:hypothetical protein